MYMGDHVRGVRYERHRLNGMRAGDRYIRENVYRLHCNFDFPILNRFDVLGYTGEIMENLDSIHVTIHLKTDTLLRPSKCAYVTDWADIDRLKSGLIDAITTGQITQEFLTGAIISATKLSEFDTRKFKYDGLEWVKVY
jgi:hypothetical protein